MLANNSFTKAAISVNGGEWKKAVLKYYDGRFYVLSHTRRLSTELPADMSRHGMLVGTTFTPDAAMVESWGEVATVGNQAYYLCGQYVKITLDPETVASVHARATSTTPRARRASAATEAHAAAATSAPAENPYMLPNYTLREYTGFSGYHASHRVEMNTPANGYSGYRIGVELETEFPTGAARAQFTATPRNWFFCESDASLYNAGCEIITIPLIPADAKNRAVWRPICDRLKALGATSWDNNHCGLHVHIGREILGDTPDEREATLSRLLLFYNLYLNDDATALKVFGRTRCYHEGRHDDTQEFAAVKCLGASVLKDKEIAKRVGDAMKAKQRGERYYTINTTNAATIEFRKGRGSLSVDRIQTIITFCEAACLYCRTSEDVSALTLDGFRDFIRATVPTTNSLYHYYNMVDADC